MALHHFNSKRSLYVFLEESKMHVRLWFMFIRFRHSIGRVHPRDLSRDHFKSSVIVLVFLVLTSPCLSQKVMLEFITFFPFHPWLSKAALRVTSGWMFIFRKNSLRISCWHTFANTSAPVDESLTGLSERMLIWQGSFALEVSERDTKYFVRWFNMIGGEGVGFTIRLASMRTFQNI